MDENNLIACGANFLDLYAYYSVYNPGYILDQGNMILFDIKKKQFKTLEIKNFPEKLNFFPHGMELYKNKYIYVINHALNSVDGERIEILEIIKEKDIITHLNYIKSIKLPDKFLSGTNGLAVASEEDIFFSTSFIIRHPATDKVNFFTKNIFIMLDYAKYYLNIKMTHLYHYKNGIITKVENSSSKKDNGVAYDPVNKLIFLSKHMIEIFVYLSMKKMEMLNSSRIFIWDIILII